MTYSKLLSLVKSKDFAGNVCADSRKVKSGDIFVAVRGTVTDGHDHITAAIANGAEYIVCKDQCPAGKATVILVDNPSKALGQLAHAGLSNPSGKLTNLAVTGTNGKTTIAYLVRSIIKQAEKKCGLIGTIEYDTGSGIYEICGFISKEDFLEHAHHYGQGVERPRTDGTMMVVQNEGGMYELKQKHLQPFGKLMEEI